MANALDIITSALRKAGVLDPNETAQAAEAQNALEDLNDMLAMWTSEGMLIYANTQENFTLTSAQSYTIGTGGTFNTVVPIEILSAFTRVNSIDYECDIITPEDYDRIAYKASTGTYPEYLSFRKSGTLGTIYTYPISTGELYIESKKLLQQFASLSTTYTMPAEALLAVKTNLSMLLSIEYKQPVDQNLASLAKYSKGVLKSLYVRTPLSTFDFNGKGKSNILGDTA